MESMDPSIAIVGPGAIGTTVAAALHEAGRTPLLAGRTPREHLRLRTPDGAVVVVPGQVHTDPTTVSGPVDVVFLAVKATQIEAAGPWLAALGHADTVVCVLQNGVEQEASVGPWVAGTVLPAVVWFPAQAEPDGTVALRRPPRLTLPDVPAAQLVVDVLEGTRCAVDVTEDFVTVAWRKLLHNAAAGLMALSGRRSGMFRREDVARLTLDYLAECLAVAQAAGARLGDDVPQDVLDGLRAQPADLGTSILTDRAADRPLEWRVRNEVVARLGRTHGIPTPVSDVVVPLLAAASDGPG
ncbi:oxidoreductase [Curtobacterium sp. MCBD17_019]|nr:oxidoreductase [Curtobacterium sp. MCBD17_019]